jgi:hypothetical protein
MEGANSNDREFALFIYAYDPILQTTVFFLIHPKPLFMIHRFRYKFWNKNKALFRPELISDGNVSKTMVSETLLFVVHQKL